jgi:hypothetical protein
MCWVGCGGGWASTRDPRLRGGPPAGWPLAGAREVCPRAHPVPDLVQVALQTGLELREGLPVHPRRALVALDLLIRLPHSLLRNPKRLVLLPPWHALPGSSQPPQGLADRSNIPGEPAPWLHPRTQSAGAPRLLRAGPPARAASVLTTSGVLPSAGLPLASPCHTSLARVCRISARVLPFHAEAADQAHAAFTPDTTRPVSGHPPGSSRRSFESPVSMSSVLISTLTASRPAPRLRGRQALSGTSS